MADGQHEALPPPLQLDRLRAELLRWYAASRRDLPWRRTRDPYAIWVSEVMLQQTRVDTVTPYYDRFLARFPTAKSLADASADEVLAMWSGLGYYRRARLLHAGAKKVVELGRMPDRREALLAVPGIGRYTAGAIASIAFGEAVGLVDGNVARVLARLFAIEDDMRGKGARRAEGLADELVCPDDPGAFNQALMELGATVCTPKAPACERCPVEAICRARATGRVSELPVLAPKKKPRPARVQALVAVLDGAVLLARRTEGGLFGGLWEPPSVPGGPRAMSELVQRFAVADVRSAGRVIHVLSHRKLAIDVHTGTLTTRPRRVALPPGYDDLRIVALDELGALGVAAVTKKVLTAAALS